MSTNEILWHSSTYGLQMWANDKTRDDQSPVVTMKFSDMSLTIGSIPDHLSWYSTSDNNQDNVTLVQTKI